VVLATEVAATAKRDSGIHGLKRVLVQKFIGEKMAV
jgi:hypothetical protein